MKAVPKILFYCQHSLGMGHLVRASALAGGLAEKFDVHFLNGGKFPKGFKFPANIKPINLPPLGFDENSQLVSLDEKFTVETAKERRKQIILDAHSELNPRALVIELFPFGRKKFADELVPLLDTAKESGTAIFCSLRDILVNKRRDQSKHDNRASETANKYFDAILVHSDKSFAWLEETFKPSIPLQVPVHYTGFVAPKDKLSAVKRKPRIVVSAGGGIVGMELFAAAIEVQKTLYVENRLEMLVVAGALLPDEKWEALKAMAKDVKGLKLKRHVPDLASMMSESAASISQCGYNTALDIIRSGVPALVAPYGEGRENEQRQRATRLEKMGALKCLESGILNGDMLANEIKKLLGTERKPHTLNLDGVENSVRFIDDYLQKLPTRIEMKKVMEVRV